YKLIAFALAGAIAGVGGNLTFISQGTVVSAQFSLSVSLLLLAIAVVGGLQSLGGCVAASIIFAGLNELFFRVSALSGYLDVVSSLLLAIVLLVYPGGLAAVPPAGAVPFGPRFTAVAGSLSPKLPSLAPLRERARAGLAR